MVDSPNLGTIDCERAFANNDYDWFDKLREYTRHIAASETENATLYLLISVHGELLKYLE